MGIRALDSKYTFIISEKVETIDYGDGRRVWGGGGMQIKWAIYIYIYFLSKTVCDPTTQQVPVATG